MCDDTLDCNVAECGYDGGDCLGATTGRVRGRRSLRGSIAAEPVSAKPVTRDYSRRKLTGDEPSKFKVSKDPDECRLYKSSYCMDIDSLYRCNANPGGAGTTCNDNCDEATGCTPCVWRSRAVHAR